MPAFVDRFIAAGGAPIDHEGEPVYWTYWFSAAAGDIISIERLEETPEPVQGIGLIAEGCQIQLVDTVARGLVLWADTSPITSEVVVRRTKSDARVGVFNVWRDAKYGTTMARTNFAGMRAQVEATGSLVLSCSDGWGAPTFDDLVVRVRHVTGEPRGA